MSDANPALRARAVEMIEFLALLADDRLEPPSGTRAEHLAWAARLANPSEPFPESELRTLRHVCHMELARLQAAVAQDEPLPRLP